MATGDVMKAIRAHTRGGADVLVYEDAPRPTPAAGEVLVQVHAAGITFAELGWDETWMRDGVDRTPVIPSHEVSGVVSELGPGVCGVAVGDEVYGLIRFDRDGAAAEYVAVPADDVAARPRTVTHVEAAAVPLAALTAWQGLVDRAGLTRGDRVLVHGAAGGVGSYAVQIAALAGADVTATAFAKDADFVRGLGATRVVDPDREDFDARPQVYDVVFDTVGGTTLDRSFQVVRRGGRLVTLQSPPSQDQASRYGITATFFIVSPDRPALDTLARLVDGGRLRGGDVSLAGGPARVRERGIRGTTAGEDGSRRALTRGVPVTGPAGLGAVLAPPSVHAQPDRQLGA
jgi:NADPH:quinone reductase-like Zn-dependent oxidoreductase